MVTVREQLAPTGGIQTIEPPNGAGQQTSQSDILGCGWQSRAVTIHLPLSVDVLFLQLRRCKMVFTFLRHATNNAIKLLFAAD